MRMPNMGKFDHKKSYQLSNAQFASQSYFASKHRSPSMLKEILIKKQLYNELTKSDMNSLFSKMVHLMVAQYRTIHLASLPIGYTIYQNSEITSSFL